MSPVLITKELLAITGLIPPPAAGAFVHAVPSQVSTSPAAAEPMASASPCRLFTVVPAAGEPLMSPLRLTPFVAAATISAASIPSTWSELIAYALLSSFCAGSISLKVEFVVPNHTRRYRSLPLLKMSGLSAVIGAAPRTELNTPLKTGLVRHPKGCPPPPVVPSLDQKLVEPPTSLMANLK